MLLASACSLRAQSPETKPSVENFSEYLFGDWAGYRETLAEHGVEPSLFIIADPFGNVTGGQRTGFTDYSLAGLDVRFDTARIFGWHGGQIRVGAAVNFGTSLSSSYVGKGYSLTHPELLDIRSRPGALASGMRRPKEYTSKPALIMATQK